MTGLFPSIHAAIGMLHALLPISEKLNGGGYPAPFATQECRPRLGESLRWPPRLLPSTQDPDPTAVNTMAEYKY